MTPPTRPPETVAERAVALAAEIANLHARLDHETANLRARLAAETARADSAETLAALASGHLNSVGARG